MAGPVASFAVQTNTPQTAGHRFELSLTALDAHQNRVEQFAGAVLITRLQGTAPVAAPPDGVFIGNTAQGTDDTASFTQADGGVRRMAVTAWRAENVQFRATHNPPAGGPAVTGDSSVIAVQAAGALHHFRLEVEGAARAGNRFNLRVTAEDASNARLTGFAGNVQIAVPTGTPFAAAAPPNPARGVLIETAPGVAGNAHAFAAADAGTFTFLVTPFTAEQIALSATSGAITSNTAPIVITAGLFTRFRIQPAPGPHAGVPFNVVISARDAFNNVLRDFLGQVSLTLDPGTGVFAAVPAPGGQHSFAVVDNGSHTFVLTTAANGAAFRVSASDGNVQTNSAPFNVLP
jgi:hypothetical protein